jgi:hypothetical protein
VTGNGGKNWAASGSLDSASRFHVPTTFATLSNSTKRFARISIKSDQRFESAAHSLM